MISQEKLNFWIKNNYNVLFVGKHGVGKTSIVKDAFERAGLRWMYFSASTMDPWVDMIGVPKEKKMKDGSSYLDLIRPKEFQNDEIEALFFDEFNRSHKKIRNAVMELIQFKSINGKKFNNLKVVWAAINPDEEDEYDVEKLDPAQADRFQIKIDIPYEPELSYFSSVYGKTTAKGAISWWKALPEEQKNNISPRRLDYALDIFSKNGDIRDVLPYKSNISKLITCLQIGPITESLNKFMDTKDIEGAKRFLQIENNFSAAVSYIIKQNNYIEFFIPLVTNEKLSLLLSKHKNIFNHVISNVGTISHYKQVVDDIIQANQSKQLIKRLRKALNISATSSKRGSKKVEPWSNKTSTPNNYSKNLDDIFNRMATNRYSTHYRKHGWQDLISLGIPDIIVVNDAEKILKICDVIANHSQTGTINQLKNYYGVLNLALERLYPANGNSFITLKKKFKLNGLSWKINRDSRFASKVDYRG